MFLRSNKKSLEVLNYAAVGALLLAVSAGCSKKESKTEPASLQPAAATAPATDIKPEEGAKDQAGSPEVKADFDPVTEGEPAPEKDPEKEVVEMDEEDDGDVLGLDEE